MGDPSLHIDNVSKRYRIGGQNAPTTIRERIIDIFRNSYGSSQSSGSEVWAIQDLSLKMYPGEILGIVGRNGAGKSTLLKILSKITLPTTGVVKVKGRLATLLEVGTGFHNELTGRENIYMCGSILGMKKRNITAKLDSIVEYTGFEKFIDTPIKRYSSGMQVRLGFAVAAHLDSDILLVDEVLAVGDVEFQKKCLTTMGNLKHTGKTVLFVSHNLPAIENLCSRAIWIDNGKLRLDGTPKECVESYLATFASANSNGLDLQGLKERRGTGNLQFTRIDFLDRESLARKVVRSGDSFILRLHYAAKKGLANLVFWVEFHTQLGTLVAQINTYNSGYRTPFVPEGDGYIDIDISNFNLMPGRYYLSVYCSSPGKIFHDYLSNCSFIDVEPSALLGLNRGISGNPIMSIACRWRHPQD